MSREKVLIVEDEENERTGLAELISSWGYLRRDGAMAGWARKSACGRPRSSSPI
jgi:hypothetical protein